MSAKLASAKADLLPRFDINFLWQTGRVRLDSDLPQFKGLGSLVSAGITLPIFTSGRIQRNIEAADARLQAALAEYDQRVLQALADVDSSYQLQYGLHRQNQLLSQAKRQARTQATGAERLFHYGHLTLDRVLSARLNAEDMADKSIQGKLAEAQNLLNVYKALGGGWPSTNEATESTH
ncbi:TolC family protein [Snodgrassella sp. CFCC 13594]|uniref:TolC family protein n=1 Tax=Snodgrassella sp. CFCC 13594 TaxID=1775559 RepID=UPI000A84D457|nr:TolC family protein [Snodgrassella sp. CFCC 13594]